MNLRPATENNERNMTEKLKIGVLASGTGSNLQAIIDACESGALHARVAVVVSDKKDAMALARAEKHGIPSFFVDKKMFKTKEEYEAEILKALRAHDAGLVVLAGYMKIVGDTLLNAYPQKVMNIHPALLPSFPGLQGIRQAMDYGVKVTGVTVHFADTGVDTGPIIAQEAVAIREGDTEETLAARIHQAEHRLYTEAIQLFAENRLQITGRKVTILESSTH